MDVNSTHRTDRATTRMLLDTSSNRLARDADVTQSIERRASDKSGRLVPKEHPCPQSSSQSWFFHLGASLPVICESTEEFKTRRWACPTIWEGKPMAKSDRCGVIRCGDWAVRLGRSRRDPIPAGSLPGRHCRSRQSPRHQEDVAPMIVLFGIPPR